MAKRKIKNPKTKKEKKSGSVKKIKSDSWLLKELPIIKISLNLLLISFSLLVSFFLISQFFWTKDQFLVIRNQIFKNPLSYSSRLQLIKVYLQNNQFKEANQELTKLNHQVSYLDEEQKSQLNYLWQEKQTNDPQELLKEVNNWQSLLKIYPDYRDGYRQLSLAYLKLNQINQAQETINQALALSPNDELSQNLKKLILGK